MGIQRLSFKSGDYDDFASKLKNANVEEKLMEAGHFMGTLKMISSNNVLISNFSINRKVLQTGTSTPGFVTFIIWEPGILFTWKKNEMKEGKLGILWNNEHQSITGSGLNGLPISIRESYFVKLCEIMGYPKLPDHLRKNEYLSVSEDILHELRKYVKYITQNENLSQQACHNLMEHKLIDLLFACLDTIIRQKKPCTFRSDQITAVLDYIHGNISEITSVHQICDGANVNERTLRRLIQKKYKLSPKKFIHMLRLNEVRKSLKLQSKSSNIIQVASEFNFWHMGQFSRDYKSLFGELPSETLRAKNSFSLQG